ncbi:unnamed protein product [Phytophthora fragariaefolia]|uniref:Unnamed protein product n=1 Tax=Phytophthora fragariaefolia TaxID=1490495 RepID=A0A9W6XRG4_9STRA|nr:unnamed protein product [Phytophthora fragariaefolia]
MVIKIYDDPRNYANSGGLVLYETKEIRSAHQQLLLLVGDLRQTVAAAVHRLVAKVHWFSKPIEGPRHSSATFFLLWPGPSIGPGSFHSALSLVLNFFLVDEESANLCQEHDVVGTVAARTSRFVLMTLAGGLVSKDEQRGVDDSSWRSGLQG